MPFELRVATDLSRRLHACQTILTALCQPIDLPLPTVAMLARAPRRAIRRQRSMLDIVIIDDDRDTRVLLDCVCTAAGYQVDHAPNGNAGLALAQTTAPQLIILDIHMPDQDGRAVARQLQTLPQPPHILLMTGDPHVLTADHSPFPLLAKPFDLDVLVAQVQTLLAEPCMA